MLQDDHGSMARLGASQNVDFLPSMLDARTTSFKSPKLNLGTIDSYFARKVSYVLSCRAEVCSCGGRSASQKSRRHIRQERGPRSDPMTQPNLQVNAEGGISDEVCAEIIQSIRFVPNFPKPVFPDHARAIGLVKSGTWRQNALCATCARLSRASLPTRLSLPHCTSHCDVGIFVLTRDSLAQGLQFKDMSMLLANPTAFRGVIDALAAKYSKRDITAVVGIGLSPNFTLHLLSCAPAPPPGTLLPGKQRPVGASWRARHVCPQCLPAFVPQQFSILTHRSRACARVFCMCLAVQSAEGLFSRRPSHTLLRCPLYH